MEPTALALASDSPRLHRMLSLTARTRTVAIGLAFAALWLVLAANASGRAQDQPGARPADGLLRLVPPDSVAVLTVEGLRDQIRAFTASRLAEGLKQLPAVQAWVESEKARQFAHSRDQIEAVLGIKLTEVCDELIGDTVVLALRLSPDAPADSSQARGLLLFQARNKVLLDRLIHAINTKQKESGELTQVTERQRAGITYHCRVFAAAAARPSEWYVSYPDGTFAFSNSEGLILSVIDRKGQGDAPDAPGAPRASNPSSEKIDRGLRELPRFQSVQSRLPAKALARLFVEPRQLVRLMAAAPRPAKAADARIMAMIARYLAAVDYAGAALVWNASGIVVHTAETLDPAKLDPWLVRWAGNHRQLDPALRRVPPTALAVASGRIDAVALHEALLQIVPDEDAPRLSNLETLLTGLLLGQDLRTRILPQLGPGVLAYVDSPPETDDALATGAPRSTASAWPFPQVLVISVQGDEPAAPVANARPPQAVSRDNHAASAAAAIENALNSVLALAALDEKRNDGRSRIITRSVAGASVTTLDSPIPFAYAVDVAGSRLVLGTSPAAVANYLEASRNPESGARFRQFQARAFPDEETFFCVDLDAVSQLAGRRHDRLVEILASRKNRPVADVDRDLSQVLAFAKLFEAAYITSRFEPEAAAVRRRVGFLLPDPKTPKTSLP